MLTTCRTIKLKAGSLDFQHKVHLPAFFEYIISEDGKRGIPKSWEKAGVKPNNPGNVDISPVDHWIFGVFKTYSK